MPHNIPTSDIVDLKVSHRWSWTKMAVSRELEEKVKRSELTSRVVLGRR